MRSERPAVKPRRWRVQDLGGEGEVLRDLGVPEDGLEIGRTSRGLGCPDDPQMSARHARLFLRGGEAFVEELGATTGVWLRVRGNQGLSLSDGAQIWLGSQVLLIRRSGNEWELRHHGPDGLLRENFLMPQQEISLGRAGDLVLDSEDPRLSRRHAQIVRDGHRLRLRDLGARNGTFIKLTEPAPLGNGDEFRIATHRFRVAEQHPVERGDSSSASVLAEKEPGRKGAGQKPGLAARLKRLGRRD